MFVIEDKIVSTEVFSQNFVCNLSKCKGACCWEGDFGAPVTLSEVDQIEKLQDIIRPHLSERSRVLLDEVGIAPYNEYLKSHATPLHHNGACAYLVEDDQGIARCSFEVLFEKGLTPFKKPISCHLYPIRITFNKATNFEAINYDEWDICNAACRLGDQMKIPVFRFVKEAIIRRYGQSFYDQMEDIYSTYFS